MALRQEIQPVTDLAWLEDGDLIEFDRGIYKHWAVYNGEGNVIHLTGDGAPLQPHINEACVKIDRLLDVASDSPVFRNNKTDSERAHTFKAHILARARSMLGNVNGDILTYNCEHFAMWCRYGQASSSHQAPNLANNMMASRQARKIIQNERDFAWLEEGDLIEFNRRNYQHWAVYKGEEHVIHLAGDGGHLQSNIRHAFSICGVKFDKARVQIDKLEDVAYVNYAVYRNNTKDRELPPKLKADILARAQSMTGIFGYNIFWNNCEHFAKWCRYGQASSDQIKRKLQKVIAAFVALLVQYYLLPY